MKRTLALIGLATLASLGSTGCIGRAISEGVGVVRGPKDVTVVTSPLTTSLGQYTRFQLQPFADATGREVPEEVKAMLPTYLDKYLADKNILNTTRGKTLLIRGTYVYYENADKALDQVFGPFEEVVARVELVDKDSGRVIGVANCVGRTTESVNKGPDDKAKGLAKAIVKWIDRNYPKR